MSSLGKRWELTVSLLGNKYGKLTVIGRVGIKSAQLYWLCSCECGNTKEIAGSSLRSGRSTSCGCVKRIRPYESLYNYCMLNAKRERADLQHTLTYEQFVSFTTTTECHYCGENIQWYMYNINGRQRYNIDRKDNLIGYVYDNLVVCCKGCNYTKGDRFTYLQFLQIGAVIRSFRCSE